MRLNLRPFVFRYEWLFILKLQWRSELWTSELRKSQNNKLLLVQNLDVWCSDHYSNTGPVFKWWSEYRAKFIPVFKWHLNTRPFEDRTTYDYWNTGLVCYSDPHCTWSWEVLRLFKFQAFIFRVGLTTGMSISLTTKLSESTVTIWFWGQAQKLGVGGGCLVFKHVSHVLPLCTLCISFQGIKQAYDLSFETIIVMVRNTYRRVYYK